MKRIQKRNKKIKELRKQGLNLSKIAERYKISSERVRQILLPKLSIDANYCKTHKKTYLTSCQYCEIEKQYRGRINKLTDKFLKVECRRLSRQNRKADIVLQRKIFIKHLRDKYKLSFPQIGRLLKRDHTSVVALYHKN